MFNRRELYITMDLMKFNNVINLLNKERIEYTYKTQNTTYQHGKVVDIGLNSKGMFLYYIYVHKDYLENAKLLIKDI
jgi:hypothetical protein